EQLLDDMDLRWQVDQLGQQLRGLFPQMGWDQRYNFQGQDPLGMAEAGATMEELGYLDRLEQLLRGAANPGALAEVDIDRARELLGDDSALSLDERARPTPLLQEAGLVAPGEGGPGGGRARPPPQGPPPIARNALPALSQRLARAKPGRHELERSGAGHER